MMTLNKLILAILIYTFTGVRLYMTDSAGDSGGGDNAGGDTGGDTGDQGGDDTADKLYDNDKGSALGGDDDAGGDTGDDDKDDKGGDDKDGVDDSKDGEGTDDNKGGDDQGGDEKPFALKLPEKSELGTESVTRTATIAKSLGLDEANGQKVLDHVNDEVARHVAAKTESYNKLVNETWLDQAKTDKEYGGENYKNNIDLAKATVDKFGTKELKAQLNKTGLGNHPELIRTFFRIGKAMQEDNEVISDNEGGKTKSRDAADLLYGDTSES